MASKICGSTSASGLAILSCSVMSLRKMILASRIALPFSGSTRRAGSGVLPRTRSRPAPLSFFRDHIDLAELLQRRTDLRGVSHHYDGRFIGSNNLFGDRLHLVRFNGADPGRVFFEVVDRHTDGLQSRQLRRQTVLGLQA